MHDQPPTHVNREALFSAFAALGLDRTDLREVVIEPRKITACYMRRAENGQAVAANDKVATVTYEIGVVK